MKALGLVAVGIMFAVIGSMGYKDAMADHRNYCQMIAEKTWPDDGRECDE